MYTWQPTTQRMTILVHNTWQTEPVTRVLPKVKPSHLTPYPLCLSHSLPTCFLSRSPTILSLSLPPTCCLSHSPTPSTIVYLAPSSI